MLGFESKKTIKKWLCSVVLAKNVSSVSCKVEQQRVVRIPLQKHAGCVKKCFGRFRVASVGKTYILRLQFAK